MASIVHGYTSMLVGRGIRSTAARAPRQVAIESAAGALTYAELAQRMGRLGSVACGAYGLVAGDVVALIAPNRLEYIELVAGLADQGIIVATLNPALSTGELELIFDDCEPKLAIVDPQLQGVTDFVAARKLPLLQLGADYEAQLAQAAPRPPDGTVDERATFAISYTSGTTGKPKGVMLPHRSRALVGMASAIEYQCFGFGDRFLAIAPMFHGAGFSFALNAVSFGGTCVILNSGDAEQIVARLGQGDIHGVFMVPTHFKRMADLPPSAFDGLQKRHRLKTIISNAAALSPRFKSFTFDHLGEGLLHETYGSTEAGIVTNMQPAFMLERPESVGTPFIGMEISIRNGEGGECAPGEIGELFARGPYAFNGYLNRPDATAEAIQDGWVTVQDLATRDEQGFISIVGRLKDMIISGGINIYPADIERVIATQPGVAEVAVVGLPDEEWGERVHAFVVANHETPLSEEGIVTACRDSLSRYKVPRGITVLDELPRNPSGKILKLRLREMAV